MLELIRKDIADAHTRENFTRISRYLGEQTILNGEWQFYQVEIDKAVTEYAFKHNLRFRPKDVILLSVDGHKVVDFRYDLFTNTHIYISTGGAACIRFLLGSYTKDNTECSLKNIPQISLLDYLTVTLPLGTAEQMVIQFNTDVGTAVGDLVVVNGGNSVTKIVNNSPGTIPNGVFGVGLNKPSTVLIDVLFLGIIGGYAGLTPGSPLFVSTGGAPTHTVPATGMVQQIGFAISSTQFVFQPRQPMRRS